MFLFLRNVYRKLAWVFAAAFVGGLGFTWIQAVWTSRQEGDAWEVASWMGELTVKLGNCPAVFAAPIGWSTHLLIALSYAMLFGVVMSGAWVPKSGFGRYVVGLAIALILGAATSVISPTASSITASILAGQGFPEKTLPLRLNIDMAFWVHQFFFLVCFVLIAVVADTASKVFDVHDTPQAEA